MWWLMKTTIPSLPYITNNTQPLSYEEEMGNGNIFFSNFSFLLRKEKVEVTLFIKYYIEPELGFDCHGEIAVVFGAELDAVVLRF